MVVVKTKAKGKVRVCYVSVIIVLRCKYICKHRILTVSKFSVYLIQLGDTQPGALSTGSHPRSVLTALSEDHENMPIYIILIPLNPTFI